MLRLLLLIKENLKKMSPETFSVIGDVKGKNTIIIDDLIDTGTTITLAARALAENGAKSIYACCTHPVLPEIPLTKLNHHRL